jgi:hypothetical protein
MSVIDIAQDKGFNPVVSLPAVESSDNGFALEVGNRYSSQPITTSGWYNVEVTGVDKTPSKTGKKMMTVSLYAENEKGSGEVRAYIGSWSMHLYVGLCQLLGIDPKIGIRDTDALNGVSGYAHIKVAIDQDGRSQTNVTTIVTKAKLLKEGFAVPGFLPKDEQVAVPAEEEAFAA